MQKFLVAIVSLCDALHTNLDLSLESAELLIHFSVLLLVFIEKCTDLLRGSRGRIGVVSIKVFGVEGLFCCHAETCVKLSQFCTVRSNTYSLKL